MSINEHRINRRKFLKSATAAGLGSAFMFSKTFAESDTEQSPPIPLRTLGKTGLKIPCLSLGANKLDNQMMLRSALAHGVNYWDTARSYMAGTSEKTIGKFLARSPELRKKIIIATKASGSRNPDQFEKRLQESLSRMNTDYVDIYYGFHNLTDPKYLTDEARKWAESAKKRKLIRFFGFTTHKNMAQALHAGAKAPWIDVVMTTYNFRQIQDPQMQTAIEAAHKAGIGLIAMKVIANTLQDRDKLEAGLEIEKTEADKKLIDHFTARGFNAHQAKIKVLLDDKRIASACIGMYSVANLKSNIEAVVSDKKITRADKEVLAEYARATCSNYCAGCGHICEAAVPQVPCISEIMRFLMYNNSYGDSARARRLFAQIPPDIRARLTKVDYTAAQRRCPQQLPIARLIAEAVRKLT